MSVPTDQRESLVRALRDSLAQTIAVYGFGSRISGSANGESDLDLAVLVEGCVDPVSLWNLGQTLAELARCPVDLLDLRAASTVMQYQIITTGERWWSADARADLYEAVILSEKTELDTARAALLGDIAARGTVHG